MSGPVHTDKAPGERGGTLSLGSADSRSPDSALPTGEQRARGLGPDAAGLKEHLSLGFPLCLNSLSLETKKKDYFSPVLDSQRNGAENTESSHMPPLASRSVSPQRGLCAGTRVDASSPRAHCSEPHSLSKVLFAKIFSLHTILKIVLKSN